MEGSLSDSPQAPPTPEPAGSRASVGRQEAIWRGRSGGFVSRVGFPWAGAGEHTVPIRSLVLCCMCFHGFCGGRSGEGRFLSVLQLAGLNQG